MSKRGKALIAIALAAGVLLVPSLTIGTSNGSTNIINMLKNDVNYITSNSIINNTISSIDIKNNSISSIDIKNYSISSIDLAPGVYAVRAYGRIEGGSLVAGSSRNLTLRKPNDALACLSIANDQSTVGAKLAPQITPLDGYFDAPYVETSNPDCRANEVAVMMGISKSFTILIP